MTRARSSASPARATHGWSGPATSGRAPASEMTNGTPAAMASATTSPKDSGDPAREDREVDPARRSSSGATRPRRSTRSPRRVERRRDGAPLRRRATQRSSPATSEPASPAADAAMALARATSTPLSVDSRPRKPTRRIVAGGRQSQRRRRSSWRGPRLPRSGRRGTPTGTSGALAAAPRARRERRPAGRATRGCWCRWTTRRRVTGGREGGHQPVAPQQPVGARARSQARSRCR